MACLNEGLPQKGKRLQRPGSSEILERASMKGFPRRGSDAATSATTAPATTRLNEGLPQKGKRCLSARMPRRVVPLASMKGFPRRGSDLLRDRPVARPPGRPQ